MTSTADESRNGDGPAEGGAVELQREARRRYVRQGTLTSWPSARGTGAPSTRAENTSVPPNACRRPLQPVLATSVVLPGLGLERVVERR